MIKESDVKILCELRKDARQPLSNISRATGIPASTIYDRMKLHEGGLIRKHASIVDFQRLGYNIRAGIMVSVDEKEKFIDYLKKHRCVNSVFRTEGKYDFFIDCIFSQMTDFQDMIGEMDEFGMKQKLAHFITDEIEREKFVGY